MRDKESIDFNQLVDHDNVMEWFSRQFRAKPKFEYGKKWEENTIQFISQWLPLQPGQRLLDYGCGTGPAFRIWNYFGLEAIGVEPCLTGVEVSKRNKFGVRVVQNDGKTIPFEDGYFDIVANIEVLHHISNDLLYILEKEFWRVLSNGGYLFAVEDILCGQNKQRFRTRWDMVIPEVFRPAAFYTRLFHRFHQVAVQPVTPQSYYFLFQKPANENPIC